MKRALVSTMFVARVAHADDAQDACMTQADRGQQLRDQSHLIEARAQFIACAREPCASVIAKQCATWLQGVDAQLPTVAFRARGADGKDIVAVRVLVDGKQVARSLDGHPIAIDPGVHTFTYQHDGDADVQEIVLVRAGEKNRPIDIQLAGTKPSAPPPVTPEPQASKPFRVPLGAALSLAGAGAAVVVMGVFVGVASDDVSRMRRTCAPRCSPSDVDDVRVKIAGANVAATVGIVAAAVATVWIIFANTGSRRTNANAMEPVLRF